MLKERDPITMTCYGQKVMWSIAGLTVILISVGLTTDLEVFHVSILLVAGGSLAVGLFWAAVCSGEWSIRLDRVEQTDRQPELIGFTVVPSILVAILVRVVIAPLELPIPLSASFGTEIAFSGTTGAVIGLGFDRFLRKLATWWSP